MEYLPYQECQLLCETAFSDVPKLYTSLGDEGSVYGSGNCWTKLTLHAERSEFEAYLEQVERMGWKPYVIHKKDPCEGIAYTALYTKGERFLCVSFFEFDGTLLPRKLFITVGVLPERYECDSGRLFKGVPRMPQDLPNGIHAIDVGDGYCIKVISKVERSDYDTYLAQLEEAGFHKVYANTSGIANRVYAAGFTRGGRLLTVTYVLPLKQVFISVGKGRGFSPFLLDDPARRQGFAPDARTSVHMLELWAFGNSFVIRLKNGHFLINDGGLRSETPYLMDYLESLTPKGEKPVVEGWFISHPHADHDGVLLEMAINPVWSDRVVVEGIYFNDPSLEMYSVNAESIGVTGMMRTVSRYLRTSAGKPTPFYRPHLGDRYYFADITVDVIMTQEQVRYKDYSGDLNDTSTWLMLTIEGQKLLLGGDGDKGGKKFIMSVYSSNYMVVDVMSVLHHGFNTRNDFTNYCHAKTVLFTCYGEGPKNRIVENDYLRSRAEESFAWGEGTRVLTFPYHVGESVVLPHFDWNKYHAGEKRISLFNEERPD